MKDARTPADGAKRVAFLLGRLTVLRSLLDTKPALCLMELCDAIASGNATLSATRYHAMTATLLSSEDRRVTGDMFKDFLFAQLLESDNRFATLAAAHRTDPPVMLAMEKDLRIVQELFTLTCQQLIDWICAINGAAPAAAPAPQRPDNEDNITSMAASAWGGSPINIHEHRRRSPILPIPAPQLPNELEPDTWVRWEYDDPGERVTYVADSGLAVVYRQFLAEEDWGKLVTPLWEFHRQYGSGPFLRYRSFTGGDDGLYGMDTADFPVWDEITASNGQKERLYANTLRFLHTGKGENALLYGPSGMGKSSLVSALVNELPELHFVFLVYRDFNSAMATLSRLSAQPFRFIAFLDDLTLSDREYRRLKAAVKSTLNLKNVLLYATATNPPADSSVFGLELGFHMLEYDEFVRQVTDEIHRSGADVDPGDIESACSRWSEDRGELTLRAGTRLAENIMRSVR